MSFWIRFGRVVTWLTVAVCAAGPTLGAVGLLTWLVMAADDAVMRRLAGAVELPLIAVMAGVLLALGPWWALAWAMLMRDRRVVAAGR